MGRRAQPVDIIKAKGKSHHLTKAETERRKKSEIKIDDKKLKVPDYIKNDIVAYEKWKELISIYKNIDIITSADCGELARYCKHYSEYLNLMNQRVFLERFEIDWEKYSSGPMGVYEFLENGINRILKLDPLIKIEALINKKSELLIKLEDRLFLNPVARIKNVPKKEEVKVDPSIAMFGG